MAVTHFELTRREPFAFDYERIEGILHFAVDPAHAANQRIVDLDRAATDGSGRVQFSADFLLLQPKAAQAGNRRLLSYIVNRGRRDGVPYNRAPSRLPTLPPSDDVDVGDGFLMRHGWSVAMCGWQWDVERQPGLIGLEAPQALGPDGKPIQGKVAIAFQPNESHPAHLLSHWPLHPPPGRQVVSHQPYPAADVDEADAALTVRDTFNAQPRVIPRARWRFARDENGQPVADDRYVWLDGAFQRGAWYEVVYTTRICPVVGTGLLATRDSASWLRYSDAADNPAAGRIDFTFAHGRSQCGRFLRQYLYDALNLDEAARPALDGLIPHVAGARRGEFNHRFAQPSETSGRGFGGLFPFASDDQTDPRSGQTDGVLHRQRQLGGVPRIFTTNTSSEYWRSDCSLIHTDPTGTHDAEPPEEERIYLIAGHQHGPGLPIVNDTTPIGARGANPFNMVDGTSVERALLLHLDRWVSEGAPPPPSAFPRLADGTAVRRETVLDHMQALPGLTLLDPAVLPTLRRVDLGPDAEYGPARQPARLGEPYVSYVSAVDADGNELAGIRLPDISVPVATHAGWVSRHPEIGGAGQLLDMMGLTLPFPATEAEREQRGDARASIAARYRDRADYVEQTRAAALRLVDDGYLLAEDVDLAVELAVKQYDLLAPSLVGSRA
jgi:hypothetical protein